MSGGATGHVGRSHGRCREELRVTSGGVTVLSGGVAVGSGGVWVVPGSAAVTCRLVSVSAGIVSVVPYIASVHSGEACIPSGFWARRHRSCCPAPTVWSPSPSELERSPMALELSPVLPEARRRPTPTSSCRVLFAALEKERNRPVSIVLHPQDSTMDAIPPSPRLARTCRWSSAGR
jgi:hypothetical protein